jgi:glucose dehydrogenase
VIASSFRIVLAALLALASLSACTGGDRSSTASTTAASSPAPEASAGASPQVAASAGTQAAASPGAFPDATTLVNAAGENDDWVLPQKNYANNRYSGLDEITPRNVGTLTKAWTTQIADDGEQEAAPLVWHGVMYVSTSHDSVLALDATTGALKWPTRSTAGWGSPTARSSSRRRTAA